MVILHQHINVCDKLICYTKSMNILGYIQENNKSFYEAPFSEVDALVISWIAYYDFEPIKEQLPLALERIKDIPYYQKLDPYYCAVLPKISRKIMKALVSSNRYKGARILDYFSLMDKQLNVQFAALAVSLDNTIVVAFRGTDLSYVGWKEDFSMSYKEGIYSYSLATSFLNNIMDKYDEPIILAGHSKGGNICTYLLSKIEDDSRIKQVYSFDGPGFKTLDLFKDKEERIKKFKKIVPQSSLVGVLFSNETEMQIIKSRNVSMLQHNPLEWQIKNDAFIYVKKRTLSSRYLDRAINSWINSLDKEQKERFTEIVFGELEKLESKDFKELFFGILKELKPIYKAYRNLEKEDKKLVFHVMKKLVKNLVKPEKKLIN